MVGLSNFIAPWTNIKGLTPGDENRAREERNKALRGQGEQRGRETAERLYGMKQADVGKEIQDIIKMRKESLQKPKAALSSQRIGRDVELARAKRKGYSEEGLRNLESRRNIQIGAQEEAMKQADMGAYQQLMGRIASTSAQLELGYGQLAAADKEDKITWRDKLHKATGVEDVGFGFS